ncbi:hypothetical protein [Plebeiibacterium sediminum]|uniref:Uncharacterized protein n=1 Tax=Plebeiibacterium sediminum TaxID=2992112 RepID=A0AAE3M2Z9_9BACT|nr:hypothetical protein [Plebeiobacterium sediminum]MCW3785874.1 hypothetical protein [Plebeiobacterium sediminum]
MISIDSKESISFMGEVSNPQKKHENLSIKDSFNRGVMWLNPGDGTVDIDPPKK